MFILDRLHEDLNTAPHRDAKELASVCECYCQCPITWDEINDAQIRMCKVCALRIHKYSSALIL